MQDILEAKFDKELPLAEMLLATGDEELVEGNHWNDTFWGVYRGKGRNELGKILMRIRENLRCQQKVTEECQS